MAARSVGRGCVVNPVDGTQDRGWIQLICDSNVWSEILQRRVHNGAAAERSCLRTEAHPADSSQPFPRVVRCMNSPFVRLRRISWDQYCEGRAAGGSENRKSSCYSVLRNALHRCASGCAARRWNGAYASFTSRNGVWSPSLQNPFLPNPVNHHVPQALG